MGDGLWRTYQLTNLPIALRKLLAVALADNCTPVELQKLLLAAYAELGRGAIQPDRATIRRRERAAERSKSHGGDR